MKTAKSSKRAAAHQPTQEDMEMLIAVMECRIEKVREDRASPKQLDKEGRDYAL
jgi:hypothetical protein